jgi:hypothetical protein
MGVTGCSSADPIVKENYTGSNVAISPAHITRRAEVSTDLGLLDQNTLNNNQENAMSFAKRLLVGLLLIGILVIAPNTSFAGAAVAYAGC